MRCSVKAKTKYVDISKMAVSVDENVWQSSVDMHAFTDCDWISAFARYGKCWALKLVKKTKTKLYKMPTIYMPTWGFQ